KQHYDEILNDVDDLKKNLTSIAKSVYNLTLHSVNEINEKTKGSWKFFDDLDKKTHERANELADEYLSSGAVVHGSEVASNYNTGERAYPSFYEIRDHFHKQFSPFGEKDTFEGFVGGPFGNWSGFHDNFHGSFRNGKTPFGYYSHKSPSIRSYNDCMTKNGESIWDSKGYWRCLFPNSEVPVEYLRYKNENFPERILTKEDFNSAIKTASAQEKDGVIDLGEKGTYFRRLEDLMNWKSIMYQNAREERANRRRRFHKQNQKLDEVATSQPATLDTPKQVVSSSLQSTYNMNSESKEVELNEIRTEYFSDGTLVTKTITKSKPLDAKDWVNVVENVEHGANKSNGGWFWNSR
ncbi:uncharacterized protein CANTADRAFT_30118, partial [Suhomyces tanzawaensis NRRL Y-17324]